MPPVVIAAGIGAAAGIGGAALSSSAQKKAAKKAASSAENTAAQNNALQERIYGQNQAILNPYVTRGNEAGSAINALLGISGTGQQPAPQPAQQPQPYGQPATPNYGPLGEYDGPLAGLINRARLQYATQADEGGIRSGQEARPQDFVTAPGGAMTGTNPNATASVTPYQNAFQNYLGSTGYQFQVDQGNKAINQGYAANGSLQSGAALKALQTYGQNTATGFFKDYLGLLGNQQGVGLSGASAVAGVGQNYANQVSANNNAAGSAAANAALARGNATANTYGAIAGGIGSVANAFGSSYRPGG